MVNLVIFFSARKDSVAPPIKLFQCCITFMPRLPPCLQAFFHLHTPYRPMSNQPHGPGARGTTTVPHLQLISLPWLNHGSGMQSTYELKAYSEGKRKGERGEEEVGPSAMPGTINMSTLNYPVYRLYVLNFRYCRRERYLEDWDL